MAKPEADEEDETEAADGAVELVSLDEADAEASERQACLLYTSMCIRDRIVLATAIAETSLTIEGVRVVIDSGLARIPVYEPDIGVTRLETCLLYTSRCV